MAARSPARARSSRVRVESAGAPVCATERSSAMAATAAPSYLKNSETVVTRCPIECPPAFSCDEGDASMRHFVLIALVLSAVTPLLAQDLKAEEAAIRALIARQNETGTQVPAVRGLVFWSAPTRRR